MDATFRRQITKLIVLLAAALAGGCWRECDPDFCDGNTLHQCVDDESGDFITEECGQKFCAVANERGLCAAEPSPRAACAGIELLGITCDGADRLQCSFGGYVMSKESCGTPELCEPTVSRCLVRPGVDASCAARHPPSPYTASYCDGPTLIECEREFAIRAVACGPQTCHQATSVAACVGTPDPLCVNPNSGSPYHVCDTVYDTSGLCLDQYRIGADLVCFSGTCFVASGGAEGGCR